MDEIALVELPPTSPGRMAGRGFAINGRPLGVLVELGDLHERGRDRVLSAPPGDTASNTPSSIGVLLAATPSVEWIGNSIYRSFALASISMLRSSRLDTGAISAAGGAG